MSKLETPLPETKEAEIHSNVHITLFLPDTVSVVPDTIPDVLETIPVVPSTNSVVSNSIPVLPNTIPVVQNANPVVSNTNSVADIRTLDQKPSTVICKICHSGGSYEQLIQPCFCKGTIGNVHLTCLERWLNECSFDRCELCLFQFTAEQIRRYTIWRSMVIWSRNPSHRNILCSDLVVILIMTVVVVFLITCLVMGMIKFENSNPSSTADLWGHCLIAVFITTAVIGYILSMYTIIKDNFRPWYRWWQNCNEIRLNRERLSHPVI